LKENAKIIIEANECVLIPNHTDSLKQIDKKLRLYSHAFDDSLTCYEEGLSSSKFQPFVKDESENECVQQSKEIEKCAYDSNEENEEIFESGVRTLPLCFSSFKLLKQNVNNVSDQKPSKHDVEYEESNRLENESYFPLCFSSFELSRTNHEKTEKDGKSVVVQSHLPSFEIDEDIQLDFQQNKVFQSCLSPPVNDVVVQIISGLDMYEGSETPSMETLRNEKTNDIEFQGGNKTSYVMIQSEMQKDRKETNVLLDSFEDYGSKTK